PDLIKWAWDRDACLVEAHSHPRGDPARLSPSDFHGLAEWVPHLWWRLRGRPYAALVFGDATVDGLAWVDGAGRPEPIRELHTTDGRSVFCTGLSFERLTAEQRSA